jgi:hypothetical protein
VFGACGLPVSDAPLLTGRVRPRWSVGYGTAVAAQPRQPGDKRLTRHRRAVETFGLPRGVFYLVMLVPSAPILSVGGYLLYRYPRLPLLAIPFVFVAGVLIAVAAARRWPTGVAHHRAIVLPSLIGYAYLYGAVGWEVGGWAAVIPLAIGFAFFVAYAIGEPDPEAMALRPVERDPDDWRWTTPS